METNFFKRSYLVRVSIIWCNVELLVLEKWCVPVYERNSMWSEDWTNSNIILEFWTQHGIFIWNDCNILYSFFFFLFLSFVHVKHAGRELMKCRMYWLVAGGVTCFYFLLQKTVGLYDAFKYSTRTVVNPFNPLNPYVVLTWMESSNRVLCNFSHWEAFPRIFFILNSVHRSRSWL
jgi:hypothetical protein